MINPITVIKTLAAVAGGLVLFGVLTVYFGNILFPVIIAALAGLGWIFWRRYKTPSAE